jgi:voltage-dependent potassium channel beta subunit
MLYRRLGRSGLQLSLLSLGSWVTYHNQVDSRAAREMLAAAMDAGVNFFDNAEAYARGQSEVVMGEAIRALKWPRLNYVVSTKFFWGLDRDGNAVNRRDTLNRKYLMQAIDGSLSRLQLDFIDLVFCHRPDPNTPIEETVWAMSDMISQGKALYWGTSEWGAADIRTAWDIAERHHLHKPVMEQPQYHLFHRRRVEQEYALLYEAIGLGLTTWSPLASGLLTGKYRAGVPARAAGHGLPRRRADRCGEERCGGAARRHRRRTRLQRRATGDRLGGAPAAGQHGDHRCVAARAVAGQPRRAAGGRSAHAGMAGAHRRHHAAAGRLRLSQPAVSFSAARRSGVPTSVQPPSQRCAPRRCCVIAASR